MFKNFCYRLRYFFVCMIFVGSFFSARGVAAYNKAHQKKSDITIVVDAGHGGADPGKVGLNNILEKDVNLSISKKLNKILSKKGYNVIMTRNDDSDLASPNSTKRKNEDLENRIKLIEDSKATITICIHQNSFPDESVSGPQVFYYSNSNNSKELAQLVQSEVDKNLDIATSRQIKNNSDYYLLRKSPTPTIIVECGFLSNPTESELLTDDTYQNKLARSIYLGINKYIDRYY